MICVVGVLEGEEGGEDDDLEPFTVVDVESERWLEAICARRRR